MFSLFSLSFNFFFQAREQTSCVRATSISTRHPHLKRQMQNLTVSCRISTSMTTFGLIAQQPLTGSNFVSPSSTRLSPLTTSPYLLRTDSLRMVLRSTSCASLSVIQVSFLMQCSGAPKRPSATAYLQRRGHGSNTSRTRLRTR